MRLFLPIFLTICLVGCTPLSAPPEDETAAKEYINDLRQKNYAPIEHNLDPSLQNAAIHQQLTEMAGLIPPGDPVSVKLIGHNFQNLGFFSDPGTFYRVKFVYEYQFPTQWIVASVTLQKAHGTQSIIGFKIVPIPDAQENLNRFTFDGKGPLHYTVFALAILVPLFILYALVICLRTKGLKWKWLWILFILCGVGKLALDWTSGQWLIGVFNIQFLGAGAAEVPYGPWVLSVSLPLGAIIFLLQRKRLVGQSAE